MMPIDNNILERDIRVFATGRKSWLFSDTVDGAKANALRSSSSMWTQIGILLHPLADDIPDGVFSRQHSSLQKFRIASSISSSRAIDPELRGADI